MRLNRSLLFLFILFSYSASAQLIVSQNSSAIALAQRLVGEGVIISNMTINGNPASTGFFKNVGGTQINMDSGIVLSTGRVVTGSGGTGVNATENSFASSSFFTPGDNDLSSIINGQTTNDAMVLEFDFIPLGDTVKFRYLLASEEYPGFICTNFNDVFAFFISGPGISGLKNMALIPGTNIPVAINSINSGNPSSGNTALCTAMGPGSPFWIHYVNNIGNQFFSPGGHTKVLTAVSAVQPCQTYHLKMAIADVGDAAYDSNVFIEAKSLKSDPIQLSSETPTAGGLPYLVEGCQDGQLKVIRAKKFPYPQPFTLSYAGTAINGVDILTLPTNSIIPAGDSLVSIPLSPIVDNIPEGIEILKIYVSNGCLGTSNFFLDSLTIQIRDFDTLGVSKDTMVCRNAPVQLNVTGNYTTFQWSPASGLSNSSIKNPIATPGNTTNYIVTAGIGTCIAKDSVRLTVKALEVLTVKDVACKNGTTGSISIGSGWEWQAPTQFAVNNTPFGADSTFQNLPVGTHIVKVKDGTGCIDSLPVNIVQSSPDLLVDDSTVTASCVGQNGQIFLTGSGGLAPYTYAVDNGSYGATSNFVVGTGAHTVKIKDANGCVTTQQAQITNDPPIAVTVTTDAAACNGSLSAMIYATATGGSGNYQYSLDGTTYQVPDSFLITTINNVVTVKDNKGCTGTGNIMVPLGAALYVNAGNDTTICEGNSVTFNTVSNAVNFTWQASSSLSSTTIKNPVATPVTTTTYYLSGTKDICTIRDTITITVNAAPIANAGFDSSICPGKSVMLQGSGGVAYNWSPASAFVDPTVSNPTVKPLVTTIYSLSVVGSNGCPSLQPDPVTVNIVPSVIAFAGNDTSVGLNQPLQLQAIDLGNSGVTSYMWTPSFGLSDPNIANPIAILPADMTYYLVLTTAEGCEGRDTIHIKAYKGPEIYVPNAFTPDGNGQNDVLRAIPVGITRFHYFKVYNRWGQLVFSTSDPGKGWNGNISGGQQGTSTFVWIAEGIDFRGSLIQRKGTVTLIR